MTVDLPDMSALPQRSLECGRCGAPFICGAGTGENGACWCATPAFRLPIPAGDGADDCLCPECLAEVAALLGRGEAQG